MAQVKTIVAFRPNLASRRSAFEAQSQIYDYLQKHYGIKFRIIVSEKDEYEDARFEVIYIPPAFWRPWRGRYLFLDERRKLLQLKKYFQDANVILTADPVVYPQARLAFSLADQLEIPVWFDASITLLSEIHSNRFSQSSFRRTEKYLDIATGVFVTVPKCIERFHHLHLIDKTNVHKFHILGHPVDTDRFSPAERKNPVAESVSIVCVSRLVPEKGHFYIIEAFSILAQRYSNIYLHLVGDGFMQDALQRLVCEKGLKDQVIFHDSVAHEEMPKILQEANIFINHAVSSPQWEEYFGAANLEAMACGLPCIVTPSGGIPYAIRGHDVVLWTQERSVSDIVNAVTSLLERSELYSLLSNNARQYVVEQYSLPKISRYFYEKICGSNI